MDILGFLLSPTGMGVIALVVICVFIVFMLKRVRPAREVLYCRERDRRGQRLSIDEETAVSVTCRSKKSPDKKFFKWGPSYVFNEGGKMVTRFIGKEGTAYTWKPRQPTSNPEDLDEFSDEKTKEFQCNHCGGLLELELPIVRMGGVGEKLGSLADALKIVWEDEFLKEIPKDQLKQIEESKIFVTVDLEPGLTPEGYEPVAEEDIQSEQDREASKIFGKGLGATTKQQLYQGMLWMALGVAATFILYNVGVFH